MELFAIILFIVLVGLMIAFVHYKNKKAEAERAARNAKADREAAAAWAVSEYNPASPNFDVKKYDELQKAIASGAVSF